MCAHSSPLGEPGTNPCGTSCTIGFLPIFRFPKKLVWLRSHLVVFGATPADVPLAYRSRLPVNTIICTAAVTALVFLRLSVLRCSCHPQRCAAYARARPRAWARSGMAAAAAATGGIPAGLGEPPGRRQLCHTAVDGTM